VKSSVNDLCGEYFRTYNLDRKQLTETAN